VKLRIELENRIFLGDKNMVHDSRERRTGVILMALECNYKEMKLIDKRECTHRYLI